MTSRNRQTLRNFFAAGKLPTQDHFGDLIDSTLNMTDEGFRKSAQNGVEISAPQGHDTFISLYREKASDAALWTIRCTGDRNRLQIHSGESVAVGDKSAVLSPVLSLDAHVGVGVNVRAPRYTLDVAGTVGGQGRIGSYPIPDAASVVADGVWHDITAVLKGCQGFEIMAGTGRRHQGRFALLHAIALNTFNPESGPFEFLRRRKQIRLTTAYYGRRCDQLQLRWFGSSGDRAGYRLQIRSKCDYGGDQPVPIQCYLTKLWFDDEMLGKGNGP